LSQNNSKKMPMKEAFANMVKNFQAETGIVMGNLNSLYNAQMQDMIINFANLRAELDATKNKAESLTKEKEELLLQIEELKKKITPEVNQ